MFKLPKTSESGQDLLLPKSQALITQSGQALLIVVLSLAVVLTIVLSILARSVTDIKISTGSEESLRAFSAAEAGIERALIAGSSIGSTDIGDANFTASVTRIGEGSQSFVHPSPLFSGETSIFWFVAHGADGSLVCDLSNNCFTGSEIQICWGKDGTSASSDQTPAIEASIVYATSPGDYSSLQVVREALDPNLARAASNNFSLADAESCTIESENFAFQTVLDFSNLGIPSSSYSNPNGLQFLVLRMLYNETESHSAGIAVSGLLPAQGSLIESSGTSGEANRKINVFQGFGELPLPFGAVVFSPTGITK